jgi:histone H3/H4
MGQPATAAVSDDVVDETVENETDEPVVSRRSSKRKRPDISDTIPAIPAASFRRLVREISHDLRSDLRWEAAALDALHVDAEAYLIQQFDDARQRMKMARVKTVDIDHFGVGKVAVK